jgi:His/Glu/Gln/Arg/opine family amino acid ABC transporter permease subunit
VASSAWRCSPRGCAAGPASPIAVATYVQVFQGTPLLIQLFLAYFGLGLFGINVSAVGGRVASR